MAGDVEVGRALAAVTAALNDHRLDKFETKRVQAIVSQSLSNGELQLDVDDGGGLHDGAGARVGAIRRTPSGEWIIDRQNETAARSDSAIPARRPEGRRGLLARLKALAG